MVRRVDSSFYLWACSFFLSVIAGLRVMHMKGKRRIHTLSCSCLLLLIVLETTGIIFDA